jgi:hypothetical protein
MRLQHQCSPEKRKNLDSHKEGMPCPGSAHSDPPFKMPAPSRQSTPVTAELIPSSSAESTPEPTLVSVQVFNTGVV